MAYQTVSLRDYVGKTLNKFYTPQIYVLDGDLSGATRSQHFQAEHPDHFIECGISETSGVSIATGLVMEGMIVTVENHTVLGGLGGAVAEMLAAHPSHPPLLRVGVQDEFTQSGPTGQVKERYGLSGHHVAQAVLHS